MKFARTLVGEIEKETLVAGRILTMIFRLLSVDDDTLNVDLLVLLECDNDALEEDADGA